VIEAEPAVEIAARVRAKELRFDCKPRARVVAHSNSPAHVQLQSERDNLPDAVEPGVTYRDVAVRWRAGVTPASDPRTSESASRAEPH
jgi:hypothetical protein